MKSVNISYIDNIHTFKHEFKNFKASFGNNGVYLIGLDCEFVNHANSISTDWVLNKEYDMAVCLIQISNANDCLVINVKELGPELPSELVNVLKSSNWIKVGVGIDNDMTYLIDNFQ